MANRWALTCSLDVVEPRMEFDRLCVSADGLSWDMTISSDVWVDPITKTAMLKPLAVTDTWATTFTGDYARLAKTDYTLATAGDWSENPRRGTGDTYLEGGNNAKATTTTSYSANQPMVISFYIPGVQDLGELTVFKCGWGTEGAAGSVTLRIRADGSIAVYKATSLVGVYALDGGFTGPGIAYSGGGYKQAERSIAQQTITLLLIPCRRRELLVVSNYGTGFNHVFADMDAFLTTNTITPAGTFWWQAPASWASCQLAPMKFKTSGTLYGRLTKLRYAPPSGMAFDLIPASDKIGVGVLELTDATLVDSSLAALVPDGIIDQARIKLAFSGDGTSTDGVYSIDFFTYPDLTSTANDPFDITGYIHELSLSVPENGAVTGKLSAFDPATLIAAGLEKADTTGDRPFRVRIGSVDILRGTTGKPTREYSKGNSSGIADLLTWELYDREREFREKQFVSALPYDGLYLSDVIEDLVNLAGFDASTTFISNDPFQLPGTPNVSKGEWQFVPQRGDTIAQWIDRLHQDYAATWVRGWIPSLAGYFYQFRNPSDLSATPVIALYQSHDDAIANSVSADLAPYRVIRGFTVERQTAEANQVIVIGQDPGTQAYVYAQYDDTASQDPTTAPGSRPSNWRGRVATVQIIDPAITNQATADRALDIATARLTAERVLATWESDLLVHSGNDRPLWKGDVVRISDVGGSNYTDYRIIAIPKIAMLWESPVSGEFDIRECQYIGEKIGSGSGSPAVSEA